MQKKGMKMKRLIFFIVLMVVVSAHGQVVKCKDGTGKIVYSDVACAVNSSSSTINLSGGNITEGQVRAAQARTASNVSEIETGESCGMLKRLEQQTFDSFVGNSNTNRWNTTFQSLQNLANMCASADVCGTVKARIDHAQQRFNQDNKAVRGAHLNSVTALYASTCNSNGTSRQIRSTGIAPPQVEKTSESRAHYTKNEFGVLVKSDSCFRTRNEFGVFVRSAGCSK